MSSSAIDVLDARHAGQRRAEERAAAELNKRVNENREEAAADFAESEQGENSAQIAEAERIMRLPTPEALKATGSVVPKDVTRFPSD